MFSKNSNIFASWFMKHNHMKGVIFLKLKSLYIDLKIENTEA